jgi:hypothetical protein
VEYLLKMSQVDPWARGSMAYFKAQFHKYNAIVDLIRDEMNRRLIQRQREYGMV